MRHARTYYIVVAACMVVAQSGLLHASLGQAYDVAATPDGVYVVGDFFEGSESTRRLMLWRANQWQSVVAPPVEVDGIEFTGGKLYAWGRPEEPSFVTQLYRHADLRWTLIGESIQECCATTQIFSVVSLGADSIAVGGIFSNMDGATLSNFGVRGGTSGWSSLEAEVEPLPSFENSANWISDILVHDDSVIVAGVFKSVSGATSGRVAVRTGGAWSALGSGFPNQNTNRGVSALAQFEGHIVAAGELDSTGAVGNVARWTGSDWSSIGDIGVGNRVLALAADSSGSLYAAGQFGDTNRTFGNIAKWDGTQWQEVGRGVNGSIRSMSVDSVGNLFVVGAFDSAGTVRANSVARWDGVAWSPLAGGTELGGESSMAEQEPIGIEVFPNPTASAITVRVDATKTNGLEISIYDAIGRRILEKPSSGTDTQINLVALPPGFYFVKVRGDDRTASRVVLLINS